MAPLRTLLDKIAPYFQKGGRLGRYQAIYEMVDTLLYSPPDVSRHAPHVRDAIDLKRVMGLVVIGVLPCALIGMWNTGYQASLALSTAQSPVVEATVDGMSYLLPIYVVTLLAGGGMGGPLCGSSQPRDQRRLLRHVHSLCADAPGDYSALASRPRHLVWRRHRQGSLWGHREEFHEPRPGRPRVPVLRISGGDVGRVGVDASHRRRHGCHATGNRGGERRRRNHRVRA